MPPVRSNDLALRCACGKIQGTAFAVSRSAGTRIVCYCDDCQAFARFLGRTDIVDRWGGTDIFQMAPRRLRLTGGTEALRCVRLSAKGMYRWYCDGCRTPLANTMGPRVPFVGLIHRFVEAGAAGQPGDDALGEPLAYVQTKFAIGTPPSHPGATSMGRIVARSVRLLATWWITGVGRPSPFFDARTRAPVAEPRVLGADERRAL
jgi:hypothetical protein